MEAADEFIGGCRLHTVPAEPQVDFGWHNLGAEFDVSVSLLKKGAVIWLLVATAGCTVNPVTGRQELALLGVSWEIATGERNFAPMQQAGGGVYAVDPVLTDYVARVGNRIAVHADRDLPYEFVVLNSDVPNAWAMPGGKIAVNRGLLVQLDSEAELAALLGHEIVHAAAGHSARNVERSLLLQGTSLIVEEATADEDYARQARLAANLASALVGQRYSREAERESDYHGMRYMAAAGYDTRAAVTLQEKLLALGDEPGWLAGLFASHPPSSERVARNRATLDRIGGVDGETGRERYQAVIGYAKSKQPAYDLAAEARDLAGRGATGQALAKLDAAIRIESDDGKFYGMKGDLLRGAGRYDQALAQYDQAILRDRHYSFYLGRGLTYGRLGRRSEAIRDLETSNGLLPTQAAVDALEALTEH